jgi:L-alanine-DL-glutamate epimerase-like enolase superfamily enzyme
VLGLDTLDPQGIKTAMRRGTRPLGLDGVLARAAALLQLAVLDSRARRAGLPVWQLLGGTPRELPVQLVEGYPLPGEPDEAFAERLAARAGEGFLALKLEIASERDPIRLGARLRGVRELVGPAVELVGDMAYLWESPEEAIAASRHWGDVGLAWLEDPMTRDRPKEIAEIRARAAMPIGAGDESTRASELQDLLLHRAVDVLRIDATTLADLDAGAELAGQAQAGGVLASAHVHPEIHRHLALVWPGMDRVEAFPLDRPFDRMHELLLTPMMTRVADGRAPVPMDPGFGSDLNLEAVWGSAYRHSQAGDGEHPSRSAAKRRDLA